VSYYGGLGSGDEVGSETVRVRVCGVEEVAVGRYRCFSEGNLSFLLCNVKGILHAIINECSHMKLPLDGGRQFGKDFICPVHGARFDIASGKALAGAAVARLKTFPVTIEGDSVLVELPAAAIGGTA
jgi:3-phenylpropionate/trans-cinnamate dioxygenase ferredoxin subunit